MILDLVGMFSTVNVISDKHPGVADRAPQANPHLQCVHTGSLGNVCAVALIVQQRLRTRTVC
jgi:hypothetical protein